MIYGHLNFKNVYKSHMYCMHMYKGKNIREILIQLVACTKLMNLEENQKDLMCMIIETSVLVVQNNFSLTCTK